MPEDPFEATLRKRKARSVLEPFLRAARLANEHALRRLSARHGQAGAVRPAHTSLLPHIELGGTRLTVLAERVGVSKQAVAPLVDELEAMGVLAKVPDPADGRAKLIVFTELGRRGLLEGLDLLHEVEKEIGRAIGREKMILLKEIVDDVLRYLEAQ